MTEKQFMEANLPYRSTKLPKSNYRWNCWNAAWQLLGIQDTPQTALQGSPTNANSEELSNCPGPCALWHFPVSRGGREGVLPV